MGTALLVRGSEIPSEILDSHRDLLDRPILASLATILPGGQPQTQPVWFSYEPPHLLINTMQGFRKERNMRADPRVTLLIIDPANSSRWLEVRGTVGLTEQGAREHLDFLAFRYASVRHFFGECIPAHFADTEAPVLGRITPLRLVDEHSADRTPNGVPLQHRRAVRGSRSRAAVPSSHLDLLCRPLIAVLTTLMPDGQPQVQPVWFAFDGTDLSFNTTRERQKGKNLERDPRATILIVDPDDTSRWIEIRGDVTITEEGALDHLDRLARSYTGRPCFYGHVHPAEQRALETRLLCRLNARHVVCDAIHRPAPAAGNGSDDTSPSSQATMQRLLSGLR